MFQAYVSIDFTEWASFSLISAAVSATVEVPVISLASAHSRYNTVKRIQHRSDRMKCKEVQTSPPKVRLLALLLLLVV